MTGVRARRRLCNVGVEYIQPLLGEGRRNAQILGKNSDLPLRYG